MRKLLLIAAMAFVLVAFSSSAMAAGNATIAVSANVVGTCQWTTAAGVLAFGALTTGDQNNIAAGTQPVFWCTNGATWTITDDTGVNEAVADVDPPRLFDGAANYIDYSFSYTTTNTGGGPGAPVTMDFSGTVLEVDYAAQPVAAYTDTVTLTIAP